MKFFLALLTVVGAASAQIFIPQQQPIPYQLQQHNIQPVAQQPQLAHPAVLRNTQMESELPAELLNNFYKNPRIADALAKDSWFGDKEMPVFQREAEKIPRDRIYKIFKNAGFSQRR